MAISPNMNLSLPVVQSTLGPTYAQMNNEAFEAIDSHSHVAGEGVQVPTAGLNINLDLPMNGFALTEANAVTFQTVVGTPAIQSIYSSGGELYYRDDDGTAVQITVNGAVDAGVGNISGLGAYIDVGLDPRTSSVSFSDVALDFSFFYDTGLLGAMNVGDIRLYPYDGIFTSYTNFITLKSPISLASNYTLTLPDALPGTQQLLQITSAGQLNYSNTLAQPLLGPNGTVSLPTFAFTNSANTGMYRYGSGSIGFSTNAIAALVLDSTAIYPLVPIRGSDGSAAAPTYGFTNDSNTGMYLDTADQIAFGTGGSRRLLLNNSLLESSVPLSVIGGVTATSINLNSGGAFKTRYYTGTTSSVGPVLNGVGGQVIGAIGHYLSGTTWGPIGIASEGTGQPDISDVFFDYLSASGGDDVAFTNNTGGSITYHIIVFYL